MIHIGSRTTRPASRRQPAPPLDGKAYSDIWNSTLNTANQIPVSAPARESPGHAPREQATAKLLHICLCLAVLLFSPTSVLRAGETITVAATRNAIDSYTAFMRGRLPDAITSFASPQATRFVVDMVLIQKALKIAGMGDVGILFVEVPNSARERAEIKSGRALMGQDYWHYDFDDSVYMTEPVVPEGRFEKGIYVPVGSARALLPASIEKLRRCAAVILKAWRGDVAVLESMGIRNVEFTFTDENIYKFLAMGRADFTLLEFSSAPDFAVEAAGVRLVPVPGIKVVLPGRRCLMVSKKHPDGKRIFEALNTGLKVLRRNGTIDRAFEECGFIQERVRDWKVINR